MHKLFLHQARLRKRWEAKAKLAVDSNDSTPDACFLILSAINCHHQSQVDPLMIDEDLGVSFTVGVSSMQWEMSEVVASVSLKLRRWRPLAPTTSASVPVLQAAVLSAVALGSLGPHLSLFAMPQLRRASKVALGTLTVINVPATPGGGVP